MMLANGKSDGDSNVSAEYFKKLVDNSENSNLDISILHELAWHTFAHFRDVSPLTF